MFPSLGVYTGLHESSQHLRHLFTEAHLRGTLPGLLQDLLKGGHVPVTRTSLLRSTLRAGPTNRFPRHLY